MKYLIEDTEEHTLGELDSYFTKELEQTNLKKKDIVVVNSLKLKIGAMEISRIFDENSMNTFYEIDDNGFHLTQTGHYIEFSKGELDSRFEDVYSRKLNYLQNKL